MAAGVAPSIRNIVLFFIGAFAMRGAGCTWNDLVDRELDAKVERTRSRPIPSGQVTVTQAAIFLIVQALVGLAVLLQFNGFTVLMGFASLGVVAIYPFMKRITYWPQIVLGLAFSWGALMGWPAVFGRLDWAALILYAGSICWVIGYDTIYAHQDREDDALIGIKSTAILFRERTKPMLARVLLSGGRADRHCRNTGGRRCVLCHRARGVRRASGVAGFLARYQRPSALFKTIQSKPRRGPDFVPRNDGRGCWLID